MNVAQRLERLNKELETDCLIRGTTFAGAQSACASAMPMDATQVRGREATIEVFALSLAIKSS